MAPLAPALALLIAALGPLGAGAQTEIEWVSQLSPPTPVHRVRALGKVVSGGTARHVWAVGDSGSILKTETGGWSWTAQTSGISNILYDVSAKDSSTAWIVGHQGETRRLLRSEVTGGAAGKILKTSDGGATWTTQNSGTSVDLYGWVSLRLWW